ncbi:MAG TPA: precorrin-2 C(20)-methyltransferase [Beijerinckiaceae bacterium]|nr:precorrin-2 C(20)-methyltransferase [Beijerinckiaceae bacterium]
MNILDPQSVLAASASVVAGTLHGIGVGPGDPELMTIRALRLIREAHVVAYFAKKGRRGHARTIVDGWLDTGCEEMPLYYPMTTEVHFGDVAYRGEVGAFYEAAAGAIALRLEAGDDVALLCEGDPLFYGSFMHVFERLKESCRISICPGVTGMSGCWAAAGAPITWGDDVLTVLPGTLDEAALVERLRSSDAAVVMKLGSNFFKVRRAIEAAGMIDRAIYVERGTMAGERILPLAATTPDWPAPYFSLICVPGRGRRP